MKILVTGAAGFIGMHASLKLLERGDKVVGIDNLNNYYDPKLKKDRLDQLLINKNFHFYKIDIAKKKEIEKIFSKHSFDCVLNLAAQAGVRYSVTNPDEYAQSNLVGFLNILEGCRNFQIKHLVYASSSSVYGGNNKLPYSESDPVNHPVSFYAATKRANELMAHSYSHLYNLPTTGLRFFTAYGPWGRPDQSLFLFVDAALNKKPIQIFNNGNMIRDFTFIKDIAEGILKAIDKIPLPNKKINDRLPCNSEAPFQIYNIGNGKKERLMDFINEIELVLGVKIIKEFMPMQLGDMQETFSDDSLAAKLLQHKSSTNVREGIIQFVEWYKSYYIHKT